MTDLLRNMLFIALGGALGALARFGAANLVHVLWPSRFPFATLAINAHRRTRGHRVSTMRAAAGRRWARARRRGRCEAASDAFAPR